jgi:hypothetical protein
MYCPNCAASIDGVKFCRSCGANVSLVPQALTGQLPQPADDKYERRRRRHRDRSHKPPSIEEAVTTFFIGIAFLIASVAVMRFMPGGRMWGWSFLIPAFSLMGKGVGEYMRFRDERLQRLGQPVTQSPLSPTYAQPTPVQPAPGQPVISAPTTSTLSAPPSITEETTRHLESSRERE